MKKDILVSLSVIGVLLALVIGVTGAIFFDREVAERNIFQVGYINLQLRDDYPDRFADSARLTWVTDDNWAPGETEFGTLRLRNVGDVDAGRTIIRTNVITVTTNVARAIDSGVTDRTDIAARIKVYSATFGEINVGNAFVGRTLRELNGRTVDLGAGIPAGGEKTLSLTFKFDCEGEVCAGYMGDRTEVAFTLGLLQR